MTETNFFYRAVAPLARAFEFQGRSRRADFWPYMLLLFAFYIIGLFLLAFALRVGVSSIAGLVGILVLLASAAVVRRLHDVGWSGWWMGAYLFLTLLFVALFFYSRSRALAGQEGILFELMPVLMPLALLMNGLGLLILIVCLLDGTAGPNRYGSDPKARVSDAFR